MDTDEICSVFMGISIEYIQEHQPPKNFRAVSEKPQIQKCEVLREQITFLDNIITSEI